MDGVHGILLLRAPLPCTRARATHQAWASIKAAWGGIGEGFAKGAQKLRVNPGIIGEGAHLSAWQRLEKARRGITQKSGRTRRTTKGLRRGTLPAASALPKFTAHPNRSAPWFTVPGLRPCWMLS